MVIYPTTYYSTHIITMSTESKRQDLLVEQSSLFSALRLLDAQISELHTRRAQLQSKLEDIDVKLIETHAFPGCDKVMTAEQLAELSDEKIQFLLHEAAKKGFHGWTINYGDGGTPPQLFIRQSQEMMLLKYYSDYSCRYCHAFGHQKQDCPKLLAKKCGACHQRGHSIRHCRKPVGEVYRQTKRHPTAS